MQYADIPLDVLMWFIFFSVTLDFLFVCGVIKQLHSNLVKNHS